MQIAVAREADQPLPGVRPVALVLMDSKPARRDVAGRVALLAAVGTAGRVGRRPRDQGHGSLAVTANGGRHGIPLGLAAVSAYSRSPADGAGLHPFPTGFHGPNPVAGSKAKSESMGGQNHTRRSSKCKSKSVPT